MSYNRLYDVAIHSDAPAGAATLGFGIAAIVLVSIAVLLCRGMKVGVPVKFLSVMAAVMLVVAALSVLEKARHRQTGSN